MHNLVFRKFINVHLGHFKSSIASGLVGVCGIIGPDTFASNYKMKILKQVYNYKTKGGGLHFLQQVP